MASFEFEGFIDNIDSRHREIISSVLRNLDYEGNKVIIERVGKIGDNFGADVRRIIVENNEQTFKMIMKLEAVFKDIKNILGDDKIVANEHIIYTEILPKFTELEIVAGVPKDDRFKYPKCYGSRLEDTFSLMLLEDLQVDGYCTMDKLKSLSDDAMKLVLKDLSALHTLSYALKSKERDTFNLLKDKLCTIWESMLSMDKDCSKYFQELEDDILKIITEEEYRSAVKGTVSHMVDVLTRYFKEDSQSKYSVIVHGDCWINNVMFLKEKEKLVSCCMIDYQIPRATLPVLDIGYTIFLCTDHDTRMKHYYDWVNYYYLQLEHYLSYHGLKANDIYPRDKLDADMRKYGKITLALGIFASTVIYKDGSEAEKVKEGCVGGGNFVKNMTNAMKVSDGRPEMIAKFKARVKELVDSHLELGLL